MGLDRRELSERYGKAFVAALEQTLNFEGGWADHPNDRGGLTYMGITSQTLSRYNSVTGQDLYMNELTPEIVADIYHELFWKFYRIYQIPGKVLPGFLFDFCVHSGGFAIKSMQRHIGTKPDGILGPKTLGVINQWPHQTLTKHLARRRMKFLCRLVQRDPSQAAFIVGWWNRVSTWF
jgi:lysozyme family protein